MDAKKERDRLLAYLREQVITSNLTHQQIADQTGFIQQNISRMLHGKYSPTVDNFIKLANAVGFSVELVKSFNHDLVDDSEIQPKFRVYN